ncbi:hypothetical protein E4U58_000546, partial [Claviceps cyperi]
MLGLETAHSPGTGSGVVGDWLWVSAHAAFGNTEQQKQIDMIAFEAFARAWSA